MEIPDLVLIFADYQRKIMFQISNDQNFLSQITEFNFPYIKLYENNCDIFFLLQIDDSLNSLTQSTQIHDNIILYTNTIAVIEDFVTLKEINYACMASSQNRFVLPNSLIAVNLSKCEKAICSLCQGKKAPYGSFYEDE